MWYSFAWSIRRWYLKVQTNAVNLLIGNSRWHWALQNKDGWEFLHEEPNLNKLKFIDKRSLRWAAVGEIPKNDILNSSRRINIKDIPLLNLPPWVGIDRALGGWSAYMKYQNSDQFSKGMLIADAGTVLSITKVTSKGEFAGGQLIAGLMLQLKAMENGTKNLINPGLNPIPKEKFPLSTSSAMRRGSIQSIIGAILAAYQESNLPICLCGGDAPLLMNEIKKYYLNNEIKIYHHPNLVLEGMIKLQKY